MGLQNIVYIPVCIAIFFCVNAMALFLYVAM